MKKGYFGRFFGIFFSVLVIFAVSGCGGGGGGGGWEPGDFNNPINISKNVQLTEGEWKAILSEIDEAGKFVSLDLSRCTRSSVNTGGGIRSDGTFCPILDLEIGAREINPGKNRIVSLTLPNAATSIVAGEEWFTLPFIGFDILRSISASAVTDIGESYFDDFRDLESVSFPKATSIGKRAFNHCPYLKSVSFPEVTSIGDEVFSGCIRLTIINLPKVISIGSRSFVFNYLGFLTINLGPNAPTIKEYSFDTVTYTDITVKVPNGATGYGAIPETYSGRDLTENWGNGFRGAGWDGSKFVGNTSNINTHITLNVVYQ
jgi:hypothetical protein